MAAKKKLKEKCFFFLAPKSRVVLQFVSRLFGSSERKFSVHLGNQENCRVFGICVHLENSFFSYFFILNQNRIKQISSEAMPLQVMFPALWCRLFALPRPIQLL